jgi:hypothetical protein
MDTAFAAEFARQRLAVERWIEFGECLGCGVKCWTIGVIVWPNAASR